VILTEVGEIGVRVGGALYVLRPSLHAMSTLGSPVEIVELFARVMDAAHDDGAVLAQLDSALKTLSACAADADVDRISETFGHFDVRLNYVPGLAPIDHILPLARCLLKHGITGALPPLPTKPGQEPEYLREFNARDHVALAMAHLGLSERDSWNLTMTTLAGALRAKFPAAHSNAPGARAPSKDQHDATMAWFEKVQAKRRKKVTVH